MAISENQIIAAMYNTANGHDPVLSVKALLKKAWDDGFITADQHWQEGEYNKGPGDYWPSDTRRNPYK